MALSSKQTEYLQNCNHRWNIKVGATGSGKSWMDYVVVIPKRLLALRGQGAAVLLGNTQGTLSRNILEPMRDVWGEDLVGNISSDNTALLFGRRVHILGADNRKHVARIQGMTIEYGYGDEMTTWNEEVFQMLKSRLRCEHSFFDGTANPTVPSHFLKKFIDSDADVFCQTSTIDDNPFLPADFVEKLKREYAGTVYYNRFILGQWMAAEGLIYRQFADDPGCYIVDEAPELALATIGVDFGGNGSAHAFVCNGITKDWRGVVTLEEYYRKEIISPTLLEDDFVDFVRLCKAKYKVYEVFCDSAEQVLIQGLRNAAARAGLDIEVKNARKGPINDRIRFYCRLMGTGRYHVLRHCRHVTDALSGALWIGKNPAKDERLDDGTLNIDSLDALEYSTEAYMHDIIALG